MKKNLLGIAVATSLLMASCSKQNAGTSGSSDFGGGGGLFDRGGGGSTGSHDFAGIPLGGLPDNLFGFTNGTRHADLQGASKGFIGDITINGVMASERTSGTVPYKGTITTNAANLSKWQDIINDNTSQATGVYANPAITDLEAALENAFASVNALASSAGYSGITPQSLDGLNTQNGVDETFVFDITSGFSVSTKINITGDAGDKYIFRWDTDQDFSNGYNGQVKFQSGGGIVPNGDLDPSNFLHVAGDIASSGGGTNPPAPYPQGPRDADGTGTLISGGSNWNGGGFFTGYWLTTGAPTITGSGQPYGATSSLSNAIFVGGWYSKTNKYIITSGSSGVHVSMN